MLSPVLIKLVSNHRCTFYCKYDWLLPEWKKQLVPKIVKGRVSKENSKATRIEDY